MKYQFLLKTLERNRKLTDKLAKAIARASPNTTLLDLFLEIKRFKRDGKLPTIKEGIQ